MLKNTSPADLDKTDVAATEVVAQTSTDTDTQESNKAPATDTAKETKPEAPATPKAPEVPKVPTTTPATPTTVAPPKETPAPAVPAAVVDKSNTGTPTKAGRYMETYIKRFLEINMGELTTPAERQAGIMAFQTIMAHAVNNPITEVLDQVYAMFTNADTRDRVLTETRALQGIGRFGGPDQMKISVFYMAFRSVAGDGSRRSKRAVNLEQVRSVLKSDALVNYLTLKIKNK